ncbi:hypothetical protein [Pseudomonas putida]|uniref:hypothetical protein n=1 Tax=Pseudomonas putida TaxID=303 RepID=UPI0011E5FE50|nr:hypothetical protein [Pseudomonas putida]
MSTETFKWRWSPYSTGAPGLVGFASSELIPLISPWARELFHLEPFLEKSCKSVTYDLLVEEFFHSFVE